MKKKYLIVIIALFSLFVVTGCGGESNNENQTTNEEEKESKITTVQQGKKYTTSNKIEFELFKIKTGDKLQAVSGEGSYYNAENGNNYVDVVITLTNNGEKDFSIKNGIKAYFQTKDGTKYESFLAAVESRDDYLDNWGEVNPLGTGKVHIGYKVPSDVSKGKAYFSINDENFVVDYDASVDVSSKTSVNMNQEISADGTGKFKLLSTKYTADVLPPNTSGYYTHYPVDDPTNDIYLVVYCDLTNDSSAAIRSDKMMSMKVIFDGKYEYSSNMVLEEKDGTGFDYSNITNINPLETRKAVFMFEVPKKVQEMNYELSIYFYGNEYSYKK